MQSRGANLRRGTRKAGGFGAWHRKDAAKRPNNSQCSVLVAAQLARRRNKVDYTRSVGWRVRLLLSIACLATSPAVNPIFARAATPPFPRTIEDRCALSVLAACYDGKAALRMSSSASIDTKADVGVT